MKSSFLVLALVTAAITAPTKVSLSPAAKGLLDRLNAPEPWEKRSAKTVKRQFMIDDYEKIPGDPEKK